METATCAKISHSARILVVVVLMGSAGTRRAEGGVWTYKTDMPTKRVMAGGGVVNGRIYVIGGSLGNYTAATTAEMYDPTVDAWTSRASMPAGRVGPGTISHDGKVYVFGGTHPSAYATGTKSVFVYDPIANTWAQKRDMPYPNAWCGVAAVDGTIYLVGGMLSVSSPPVSTVLAYDPLADTWTRKADMPTARGALSACAIDGQIYAIGGAREDWTSFSYQRVEVYDPSTDTWMRKADMPTPRWGLGTCAIEGKIYAIGGRLGGDVCAANEVYDPMTDTWTAEAPMQQKRNGAFVCAIEDKIYAIGGVYIIPQETFLATMEEYDTGLGVPCPDFDGSGFVDIGDLLRLIESWGQDDPAVDIAPPPFGDGLVDALDLEVLMSYWGQEIPSPDLIAHWKLDETQGIVAFDSIGGNDGIVTGVPLWRADGGQVRGALELDGACSVVTEFVLDPSDGPFSVFAWVKGGAPGQAIVSQTNGANWLMADPAQGLLMTELKDAGRLSRALCSQTMITDGAWHRVGLVWDGSHRILYVDDVEVARDTQSSLVGTYAGLHIGAGKALEPSSFFAGLIDDVRLYNRAVEP